MICLKFSAGHGIEPIPIDCSQQESGIWGTPIAELSKMCSVVQKSDCKNGKDQGQRTLLIDVVSRLKKNF